MFERGVQLVKILVEVFHEIFGEPKACQYAEELSQLLLLADVLQDVELGDMCRCEGPDV